MAKKVLIISTSIRPNSNSEILANAFADGARTSGNEVELISLKNKTIDFCKGCFACQKLGHCVIKDDANAITEKMLNADVIVWATPIYYYLNFPTSKLPKTPEEMWDRRDKNTH